MQFQSFETGIEVNGRTVLSIVSGLGAFKSLSKKHLLAAGIGRVEGTGLAIEKNGWYSQDAWLKAFESISKEIGDNSLFRIGQSIPENAEFPPWVEDIESAIKSIDIAYHINHRKDGKVLFDTETGNMSEGIGHYGFEKIDGKNMIVSECKNPYPCAFDRGIISAMTQKFEANANVVHDDSKPCRKNGADSCTYIVTW